MSYLKSDVIYLTQFYKLEVEFLEANSDRNSDSSLRLSSANYTRGIDKTLKIRLFFQLCSFQMLTEWKSKV